MVGRRWSPSRSCLHQFPCRPQPSQLLSEAPPSQSRSSIRSTCLSPALSYQQVPPFPRLRRLFRWLRTSLRHPVRQVRRSTLRQPSDLLRRTRTSPTRLAPSLATAERRHEHEYNCAARDEMRTTSYPALHTKHTLLSAVRVTVSTAANDAC